MMFACFGTGPSNGEVKGKYTTMRHLKKQNEKSFSPDGSAKMFSPGLAVVFTSLL